jgi:hypothetical protein
LIIALKKGWDAESYSNPKPGNSFDGEIGILSPQDHALLPDLPRLANARWPGRRPSRNSGSFATVSPMTAWLLRRAETRRTVESDARSRRPASCGSSKLGSPPPGTALHRSASIRRGEKNTQEDPEDPATLRDRAFLGGQVRRACGTISRKQAGREKQLQRSARQQAAAAMATYAYRHMRMRENVDQMDDQHRKQGAAEQRQEKKGCTEHLDRLLMGY